MDYAACNGNFPEVQRLHAAGTPWSARTCAHAAFGHHLDILKWARENGCPWDRDECLANTTDPKTIEWIKSGAGDCLQQAITKSAAPRRAKICCRTLDDGRRE